MASVLYHSNIDVGDMHFEVVFEKVNPLTNRLNNSTARVYYNGYLDFTEWYSAMGDCRRQIDTAKLIDNFITSLNFYRINQEEFIYMTIPDNEFSLLGRQFYYETDYSFKKYLETGELKRTYRDALDYNCLLGLDPDQRYDGNIFYNEAKNLIEISFRSYTEKENPTEKPRNLSVPSAISHKLPFIEANTKEVSISHLSNECVVPVFSKDNEITISHQAFIESVWQAATKVFSKETIEEPSIRVSHVIKGRTPEAIHKNVRDPLEEDQTMYWERMMFCIEIPSVFEDMDGNRLNLTIGGVRAYNHMNLYSKKTAEKFKVFIGFKNMVCCNLCISTDGFQSELKVMDISALFNSAVEMFRNYNISKHLYEMGALKEVFMTEQQFAQFLGRSRLYGFLSKSEQKKLPQMLMTDTQIGLVARSYYQDENFSVPEGEKEISMWKVYNLLTGANKSSYIDNFLDRSLNATELAYGLTRALHRESEYSWFLN